MPILSSRVGMDSDRFRHHMVSRLQKQGLQHEAVILALQRIPRHGFVDSALIPQAYEDTSLPIGFGQTISKPSVVARMCELLLQAPIYQTQGRLDRVLEIGTGCGYQAAVLCCLAKQVYSIERIRGLYERAIQNLHPLALDNLQLAYGDGIHGWVAGKPYAGIISAAGGDGVPQSWLDQLALGGRLVAPCQRPNGSQYLLVVDRTAQGWHHTAHEDVMFVPLQSGIR